MDDLDRWWSDDPGRLVDEAPTLPELLEAMSTRRPAWQASAACRGVGVAVFFGERGPTAEARQLCRTCTVRAECLRYAVDTGAAGYWGGLPEHRRPTPGAPERAILRAIRRPAA